MRPVPMRSRLATSLALLVLAGTARAQPYVPPGMPLPDPPPSSVQTPTPTPTTISNPPPPSDGPWYPSHYAPQPVSPEPVPVGSTARSRFEWGLGALVGRASREAWVGTGVELELSVLYDLRALRLGALLTTGALDLGASAVVGTRFRLSPGLRLDLAGDGGYAYLDRYAGTPLRPTLGARAGITWVPAAGGRYVSLGVAVRHRFAESVRDVACPVGCPAGQSVSAYGGTIAGGFLTWGGAPPDR